MGKTYTGDNLGQVVYGAASCGEFALNVSGWDILDLSRFGALLIAIFKPHQRPTQHWNGIFAHSLLPEHRC